MAGSFDADVDDIDAFLADAKTLIGGEPLWRPGGFAGDLHATWGIADSVGVSRGELRFRVSPADRTEPSISVIYRGRPVWRVDIVPPTSWKPNPPDAVGLGLPPRVDGPHEHAWPDNREYVRINGFRRLPNRRPLPAIRRLPQALAALAARINLTLGPDQRGFDVPPRTDLFN
jgi:hypothetical protein